MGRAPCCDKANVKRGPWSPEEDAKLKEFIEKYGTGGNWIALPHKAGLRRCGKSCRLRWLNYLRPNIKHGEFSDDEDRIICTLFATIGSRWSIIAAQLPGRTDNDIKNYWNTKLKKKLLGIAPNSQRKAAAAANQQQQGSQQGQHNQQHLLFSSPSPSSSSSLLQPRTLFSPPIDHCGFPPTTAAAAAAINCSSQDIFNSTTAFFQAPHSFSNQYHISFGGGGGGAAAADQQSCSSSEQSYEQQLGFESYLYGAVEENQNHLLGHQQQQFNWGSDHHVPLEYGYDEIKSMISGATNYINLCNNNNNNSAASTNIAAAAAAAAYVDDTPGSPTGDSSKTQGRGEVMYHF